MNLGEFERLEHLTFSLLKNHRAFTSDEFMEAYDIIYDHCTEITPVFETKGKKVYESLKSTLSTFSSQLRYLTSLRTFHAQVTEFSGALELVAKVYSYLEKYFIRISLEKRDGHIQDIRTLGHSTFYRDYAEKAIQQIKDLILFEIGVARSSKSYNFSQLSETVRFVRNMLFHSDREEEYENLMKRYLVMFQASMDFDGEIGKVLKRVYLEIYITSRVFEPDSNKLHKNIVSRLKGRFDDILRFITHRMSTFCRFKLYAKIVHFMDGEYTTKLIEEYTRITSRKILESNSFEDLVITYLKICKQMEDNFVVGKESLPDTKEQVKQYFDTPEGVAVLNNKIPASICRVIKDGESVDGELETLVVFITLVPNREAVIEQVTLDLQKRLLGAKGTLEKEKMLVSLMEKYLGMSSVTRAIVSYNNQVDVVENSFNLSTQSFRFLTELKFLTKGFYNVRGSSEELPYPLIDIQKIITQPQFVKHPRGEMISCYDLSPMIFQMNSFNFRISTDRFLILAWLSVERGLDELKECVGGTKFKRNLEYLLSNGFITLSNGIVSLNESFSSNEYNYIRNKYRDGVCQMDKDCRLINARDYAMGSRLSGMCGEETEEVLDLFEIEYEDAVEKKRESVESMDSLSIVAEARIMKMLKRMKKIELTEIVRVLVGELGVDEKFVLSAMNRLVEKEYAVIDDKCVSYLS